MFVALCTTPLLPFSLFVAFPLPSLGLPLFHGLLLLSLTVTKCETDLLFMPLPPSTPPLQHPAPNAQVHLSKM